MSVLGNVKSKSHRKAHTVEPDDTGRRSSRVLPGEAWRARAIQESAEAIVATRTAEKPEERRAEEQSKEQPKKDLGTEARRRPKLKEAATAATVRWGRRRRGRWMRPWKRVAEAKSQAERKRRKERAQ